MASDLYMNFLWAFEEIGKDLNKGDEYFEKIYSYIPKDELDEYKHQFLSEDLTEAIDPSKALEVKKNSDADVIFYGYQYKNEKPVEFDPPRELSSDEYRAEVQTIVNSKTKLNADKPQANRYSKEHDFIFYALYNRKNESNEKDDNKMNEVFGDIVNYESAEDWIERIESQEGQISIFDDEDKDTFEKFAKDVYFYAKNNGFKRRYVEDDFIQFKKTSNIPEGELATFIDISGNTHEIYLHAQIYGSDGFLIGEKYRHIHNMAELKSGINEIKNDAVKNIKERENEEQAKAQRIMKKYHVNTSNKDADKSRKDSDLRAKLKARHPELDFGDEVTEDFDDDMEFDIDESHETRLMDSLYEGSDDFDEYDDDAEWWNDTLDDETGDFIYQAADQLGLEDFWFEDGGYEGAHTPTEFGYTKDGINYKAECDYEDTDVHSVPSAVKLLKNLDWRAE